MKLIFLTILGMGLVVGDGVVGCFVGRIVVGNGVGEGEGCVVGCE